jgi:hypothetical protein
MPDGTLLVSQYPLYRTIAHEAAARSRESLNANRTPKPNGEPGFILHGDNQVSFKQALIAVAFSGIYLEALIKIVAREAKKSNRRFVAKRDKKGRYGGKLEVLGIKDKGLIAEANRFNDVRDDLIHEDSYELSTAPGAVNQFPDIKMFIAQDEAQKAVEFIDRVTVELSKIYRKKETPAP